jgi:hypothetical protein
VACWVIRTRRCLISDLIYDDHPGRLWVRLIPFHTGEVYEHRVRLCD